MNKVVRDGMVAVLYSPSFGAGWFSWNREIPECLFHADIVALVEAGKRDEITDKLCKKLFGVDFYSGGSESLEIAWLPEGMRFNIDEYDGSESVELEKDARWLTA